MGITNESETPRRKLLTWLKRSLVPLAGLLGALAIFVIVGWLSLRYHEFFENINEHFKGYEYLGVFVISLVLNATIIIPVSAVAVISSLGVLFLPFAVGIVGGIGAAIGEMTGYVAGRAGRDLLAKNKIYVRVERWVARWGMLSVFLLSIFPFLFDIVGIIAGATKMPIWKFFISCWLGRTILYVTAAYLGHFGISFFIKWFS
jgi:membrane protein DedA with SNARE-associated domain